MAKSSFSSFSLKLSQKMTKNDQKSTHFYTPKLGHNLTTKRGDSGSAGLPEEKCVMNQAPKLVTKNDQKLTQQQKSDKK